MEKIYAKTLNPESFDYRIYDIREDDGNEVIIDGGRDFCNIDNKGYLTKIKKMINEYSDYELEVYHNNSIMDFLNYYLPAKENGKRLSPKEMAFLKQGLDNSQYANEEIICDCLSVITGKIWKRKGLRGCCQGDYVDAYYPVEDGITKYLDWIEAWFFGTGTEVLVYDGDLNPETADDIEDGYTFYTASWRVEDLKKEIRDYVGAKDDVEVVLWKYSKTRRILIDEYELAD